MINEKNSETGFPSLSQSRTVANFFSDVHGCVCNSFSVGRNARYLSNICGSKILIIEQV
jgi:hypothetical protein